MLAIFIIFLRILQGLVTIVSGVIKYTALFSLDFLFTLFNLITPNKSTGHVVPAGHPGNGGKWPAYIAPGSGDSRSACPALNTMANHGIIPRDGKNIKFTELAQAIRRVYNLSPAFAYFLSSSIALMLSRTYATDRLDLADVDAHNCIEHDGSLVRVDIFDDPDQGKIAPKLVDEVLKGGTGPGGNLTLLDFSRLLGRRRVEAKRHNPTFSLDFVHKIFASANGSLLKTVFGGRVDDLRSILGEERLPDGWEPRVRRRMGLTTIEFNFTLLPMEFSIKEEVDGSMKGVGQERYHDRDDTSEAKKDN
ncbi:Cloroperoxidase [Cubamyces menziesii]|nr:Cloroperoxidase [Cubamyces menziesii]